MTTDTFCHWLHGFLEGMGNSRATLSKEQVDLIRLRLDNVVDDGRRQAGQYRGYIPLSDKALADAGCCRGENMTFVMQSED